MPETPPVLLTVWRRPESARRVVDALRVARPARLFIASDGPGDEHDEALVLETRREVLAGVDWNCEIETLHRERNLGCRLAMAGAIDWFFDRVPEGIILEDDCLPHPDFFPYCAELLARYRDDYRVMHIGGDNSTGLDWEGEESYRFVRWPQVWGWATWRRAWRHYDRDLTAWAVATRGWRARRVIPDAIDRETWMPILRKLRETGEPDTWDYQWVATNLRLGGVSIVPRSNLITNTGFGAGATHTHDPGHARAHRPTQPLLPLVHPGSVLVDPRVDRQLLEQSTDRQRAAQRLAARRTMRGRTRRIGGPIRRMLGSLLRRILARAHGATVRP